MTLHTPDFYGGDQVFVGRNFGEIEISDTGFVLKVKDEEGQAVK